ncbi:DUF4199 domain-containing protein [Flavobacterium agricola]|uniref:DUF4199 domain-containing protein n=2 Tax=Flavobacterium agricola TaxID=2870839 RepID=A0ABY6M4K5_9FLAO|nr:DUF4199 domain-containing protein [Flavobacterium agricola]
MNKNVTTEIKWALIFSVVGLAWMVLENIVGLHDTYLDYHLYLTNLFAFPAIYMMVAALKEKRTKAYNGTITYLQGLLSGTILSAFIALLSPLTQWITSYVITPKYFPNVIVRSVELGYFESTAAAQAHFNYANYATQGMLFAFIIGVITTAIAMLFIKNNK